MAVTPGENETSKVKAVHYKHEISITEDLAITDKG